MANVNRALMQVGTPKLSRSVFNLSEEKLFTGKMGFIYPSYVREVVPNDIISIAKRATIRTLPTVAPLMSNINMIEHTFFVPYRLLMNEDELGDDGDFEDMIIGGSDGDTEITIPTMEVGSHAIGDLKDYMGFPPIGGSAVGAYPVAFPFRAYRLIWNEYYRDVELDTELDITAAPAWPLQVRWRKDYFTSARLTEQRGTSLAVPIDIVSDGGDIEFENSSDASEYRLRTMITTGNVETETAPSATGFARFGTDVGLQADSVDVNQMRTAFQTQRWAERNMRAGVRYPEFLKAHFGYSGFSDARLQRPEYLGGWKMPIITSEVLATTYTDEDSVGQHVGQMSGHGIGVDGKFIAKFRVPEYGLIMSCLFVMPDAIYSQGIERQWRKDTLYDFYFREFANISEQAILQSEIYAMTTANDNDTVFGYQGRYNEMRMAHNKVCGQFRYGGTLNYWTLAREFASAPTLGPEFLQSRYEAGFEGGVRDDVFAVTTGHNMIFRVGNIIKAVRPMPLIPDPGYLDHN